MNKAIKTKENLSLALIELLQSKPLDLITVKELVEKAQISRTAFYNHFQSLEDVLKYTYRKAHKKIFKNYYKHLEYVYSDQHIKDMIHFFDENSALLLALIKWNLIEFIAKYNTELVLKYTQNYHDDYIKNHAFYFICYYHSSLFNLCTCWINNGKKENPQALFFIIKQLQNKKLI